MEDMQYLRNVLYRLKEKDMDVFHSFQTINVDDSAEVISLLGLLCLLLSNPYNFLFTE